MCGGQMTSISNVSDFTSGKWDKLYGCRICRIKKLVSVSGESMDIPDFSNYLEYPDGNQSQDIYINTVNIQDTKDNFCRN